MACRSGSTALFAIGFYVLSRIGPISFPIKGPPPPS